MKGQRVEKRKTSMMMTTTTTMTMRMWQSTIGSVNVRDDTYSELLLMLLLLAVLVKPPMP